MHHNSPSWTCWIQFWAVLLSHQTYTQYPQCQVCRDKISPPISASPKAETLPVKKKIRFKCIQFAIGNFHNILNILVISLWVSLQLKTLMENALYGHATRPLPGLWPNEYPGYSWIIPPSQWSYRLPLNFHLINYQSPFHMVKLTLFTRPNVISCLPLVWSRFLFAYIF